MPELLSDSEPKANKTHKCDLCEMDIAKGEKYKRQQLKYEGDLYAFKMHKQCSEISSLLWNFIDPDEGMTSEDFTDGCQRYCWEFVCPHCPQMDEISEECKDDKGYCLDRILQRLTEKGRPRKAGNVWIEREVP